jgi:archaeal flagellar protein FlaF
MGFGSVIATAISIIVLMTAGYILVGGVTHSADVTGASVKSAADLENQRLKTVLQIDDIGSNMEEGWFSFHLKNVGAENIENITKMDVIVKLTGLNDSVYYVPYLFPGEDLDVYWGNDTIGSIVAGIGDAVNPGMLDPGEDVNILVHSEDGFPTRTAWVQVTAPNGASASANIIIT